MIVWLTTVHRIQDGTGHSKTETADKEKSALEVFLCLQAMGLMIVFTSYGLNDCSEFWGVDGTRPSSLLRFRANLFASERFNNFKEIFVLVINGTGCPE